MVLTAIREAVKMRALKIRVETMSTEPHEFEVKRWVEICIIASLTGESKGAYSASVSLLCTARKSNNLEQVFSDQGDAMAFMEAPVRENCAYALQEFHKVYPDGYYQSGDAAAVES